jgi:hypothetical protein
VSDELDETRAFLDGLTPPAKPGASPPARGRQQIDDGAAHLAATLTELKVSTQRLHADLAQRMWVLEAKVDQGLPDWSQFSQAVVRAGEESGRKAVAHLVAANEGLMAEGRRLNERRAQDLAYLWALAKWVALPLAVAGFAAIAWGIYDAGTLGPRWALLLAYLLGVGTVILGVQTVEWLDAKLRQRTWWRRQ